MEGMDDYLKSGFDEYLQRPVEAQAPTSLSLIDVDGAIEDGSILGGKIVNLEADKLASGTITAVANLGEAATGYVKLDGQNNRIVVHDGTTNRIVIGNV